MSGCRGRGRGQARAGHAGSLNQRDTQRGTQAVRRLPNTQNAQRPRPNHGLWATACRLSSLALADHGGVLALWGCAWVRMHGNLLHLLLNFSVKLKLL